ncbi:nucleotide sugar dehydrogenase [Dorea acetigenes]|uniref:UDP-glucose 6-dehydrogenase n=1 Tax=Dorea acetigenes TaxID=2981787 RepID=A0ABT2RKX9_9FIRM|nr:nucleotide sugar dehydrogenase [Dorea acetigenes]MCU6686057.1 nucleotide sugar dehydrogenase [Dorea acetigenes]SCI77372.1 UDP-glucose 6-dehydrogenase [uncultured Clostridium sp.]
MKIAVAGAGYVGLSLAVLLSQDSETYVVDIDPDKIEKINQKKSPIKDAYIEDYLKNKPLKLKATLDWRDAFREADYVIIATPTNYIEDDNYFDTSAVEDIIDKVLSIPDNNATIVIKSTIPIGYTEKIRVRYGIDNIFFSPEFLREGKALYDNLYPSRIVIGAKSESAHLFAKLLTDAAEKTPIDVMFIGSTEAEAVKLFSNTYLAMRISYFNELDTYAELNNLNSKEIIESVCLDPRIGNYYNNPSFGYGGYCLPKDTKQLLANFNNISQKMISATVEANSSRKKHIVNMIIQRNPHKVGIYRLTMKSESDNFRSSAIIDILDYLEKNNLECLIYEPEYRDNVFHEAKVQNDLNIFLDECDLIIANRMTNELMSVRNKVYTRDLFGLN